MNLADQVKQAYGLDNPICKNLNTLANDAFEVASSTGHFALKIYHVTARVKTEIQWEIDLTLHLIANGAPVVRPVAGKEGSYLQTFTIDGHSRMAVLFEWALGEKPQPDLSTYELLGQAAARIHAAADTFTSRLPREKYDAHELIDDQLERMKIPLQQSGQWQRVFELSERMRKIITNPQLDYGIIQNDLTLDNIHRHGDTLTVFDFDSAAPSWRAAEPWGVLKASKEYFEAWLKGYRSVRQFNADDEKAVAAFVIVEDIRNVVWNLGLARSSRGEPLLKTNDLPGIVDAWLKWELREIS